MELLDSAGSFLSLICLLFLTFFCWLIYKQIQFYVWKLPPGPIGFPFLGYLPFIFGKEVHKELHRLIKIYGPIFSISLGPYSAVIVSDYEKAKELLSHPASLARPPKFFDVLPEKGGFAGMNGNTWKEYRRLCTHALHKMERDSGLWKKIIKKDVDEVIEDIKKFEDKPTDISYELARSVRSNLLGLLLSKQFTKKETNPDVQILEKAFRIITQLYETTTPIILMPWLLKVFVRFNIAGYAEKMKAVDDVRIMMRREIKARQNGDSTGFIGHYFDAPREKRSTNESENCTVPNLIGNLAALYFGGIGSTVASIQWLLVLMAAFPEVQEKVHEELDNEVGKDEHFGWDDRKKFPYTMATILEMQRWASVVPVYLPRCVSETYEFKGYRLWKGIWIFANGWAIHHDPKHWDEPQQFKPERFIQTADAREKDRLRLDGYAPFSFGKRNCPAETIAMMIMFLYFAGLMQKFTIKQSPPHQVDISTPFGPIRYPKMQDLCFIRRQ